LHTSFIQLQRLKELIIGMYNPFIEKASYSYREIKNEIKRGTFIKIVKIISQYIA